MSATPAPNEPRNAKFLGWRFDEKNQETFKKWEQRWLASEARWRRAQLGFVDEITVEPVNTVRAFNRRIELAGEIMDLVQNFHEHFLMVRENFLRAEKSEPSLRKEYLRRMSEHARFALIQPWCWVDEKKGKESDFFAQLARRLEKIERAQISLNRAEDKTQSLNLLTTFQEVAFRDGELPTKSKLEEEFFGTKVSADHSNRRTFNRLIDAVGLGGLPERPKQKRQAGPVRNTRRRKV